MGRLAQTLGVSGKHRIMLKRKNSEGTKFLRFFGPLLDALRKLGGSGTPDEVVEQIAADLGLSDEEQNALLPSGGSRFKTNVAWARFYLVREGLLDSSRRGIWSLTESGLSAKLSVEQAGEVFSRWVKVFDAQRKNLASTDEPVAEQVAEASGAPSKDYRGETLDLLLTLPPSGFERLAQRLLREAGFTQVAVTGKSGDGGIDGYGTLQINHLVTFKVLFQCKRYAKSVSSSHDPGRDRAGAAVDGVETVARHIIGKAARAADAADEHRLFARGAEVGHGPLDRFQDGIVAAARTPAHFLIARPVFRGGDFGDFVHFESFLRDQRSAAAQTRSTVHNPINAVCLEYSAIAPMKQTITAIHANSAMETGSRSRSSL